MYQHTLTFINQHEYEWFTNRIGKWWSQCARLISTSGDNITGHYIATYETDSPFGKEAQIDIQGCPVIVQDKFNQSGLTVVSRDKFNALLGDVKIDL